MKNILITGAAGYVGSQLLTKISSNLDQFNKVVAMDLREVPESQQLKGIIYISEDIRSENVAQIIDQYHINSIVHLAAVVTPGQDSNREFEYSIDVLGTKNVLEAAINHGVRHFITTSSGAAYGYHQDNPEWISEEDSLRGNPEFAYSDHKRLVEEMLADYRKLHPELKQTIFRVGTILGNTTRNQITALFERKKILVINGFETPFVFIWDQDLINIIHQAIITEKSGIYNVAGDGAIYPRDIAKALGKNIQIMTPFVMRSILRIQKWLKMSNTDPAQLVFIMHRPVLANKKLKEEFGDIPLKTSREAFTYFIENNKYFKP